MNPRFGDQVVIIEMKTRSGDLHPYAENHHNVRRLPVLRRGA